MCKRRKDIPAWAAKQRLADMLWIAENLTHFWEAAWQQYQDQGRGAIVVDTTEKIADTGHPFTYLTQAECAALSNQDAQRMIRTYNPKRELVIVLLKEQERESTYRIGVQ